jgi:hypothetical protein
MKVMRILCILVGVLAAAGTARAQVLYSNDMNNANNGGSNRYGFGGTYSNHGQWSVTHLPAGGWQGSGAAQLTLFAGQSQYQFGWWTPHISWAPTIGDSVFLRFRLKWPSGQPSASSVRIKFAIIGSTSDGSDNTSRVITFLGSGGASACTLDQGTEVYGGAYQEYHKPSDYGISLSGDRWNGNYVGLAVNRNIEGPGGCATPPVLMTSWNNSNRGTPGYVHGEFGTAPGAAASDGWYHIQIEAKSGTAGNAYLKQWANTNNYSTPTSKQVPLRYANGSLMGLAVTGWDGASLGHFIDTPPSANFSYILDDFQIGRTFDPNWYAGGSGGGSSSAPAAPSNLRILSSSIDVVSVVLGIGIVAGRFFRRPKRA